ncbi:hypothetical protein ACJJTC_019473 [Scirpophaga incertulas]
MSDLGNKKKQRTVVRRIFTKCVNDLEAAIVRRETAVETQILFEKLKEKYDHLLRVDKIILDLLLTEVDEQILENELEVVMEYNTRMLRVNAKYKELAGLTTSIAVSAELAKCCSGRASPVTWGASLEDVKCVGRFQIGRARNR